MKALLLGAGGQVGRALAASAPEGVDLTAFDRKACDISDAARIRQRIRETEPNLVLNAAAYTKVDLAESEPELAALLNAQAPGAIGQAAAEIGARVIHFSTDFVFDGEAGRPYRPDDRTAPLSAYGRTKLEGERTLLAAAPDALIVRTAWVYAALGANFVNTMLRLMRERDEVRVVADQIGTPTHATSLARAAWALAEARATGIHHFTDAGVASWYDFAVAIAEEGLAAGLLERPTRIEPIGTADFPTPARRPACGVLHKGATWQAIGYRPRHWRAELRNMLKELQELG